MCLIFFDIVKVSFIVEKIFRTEEASFEKVGLVVIGVSVHDSIRVPVCLFRAFEENIGSSLAVDSNIPSRG